MTDSDGTVAPGSTRPYVDDIFDEASALTRVIGKAKLGDAILEAAQKYAREYLGRTDAMPQAAAPSVPVADEGFIDNVQGRIEALRKNIGRTVNREANRQWQQENEGNISKDRLGPKIQETWKWLYQEARIPWRQGVRSGERLKTLDEDQLRRLLCIINREA